MKLSTTLLALSLPLLASGYTKHTKEEAYSQCAKCLESPQNRYCTDGTSYFCCDMAENSAMCDPGRINGDRVQGKIQANQTDIQCSHVRYTKSLSKYKFCPQKTQSVCQNSRTVQLSSSLVPMASILEDSISLAQLPPGHLCTQRIELQDNQDSSQLLEIELKGGQAEFGLQITQMLPNGTKNLIDLGFIDQKTCLLETNCSINMRGKRAYYLSGVQLAELYIVNRGSDNIDIDLQLSLKSKTQSVALYIIVTMSILVAFLFSFQRSTDWMKEQLYSQTHQVRMQNLDTEHLDTGSEGNVRKSQ